jgi:hypothetical protein
MVTAITPYRSKDRKSSAMQAGRQLATTNKTIKQSK